MDAPQIRNWPVLLAGTAAAGHRSLLEILRRRQASTPSHRRSLAVTLPSPSGWAQVRGCLAEQDQREDWAGDHEDHREGPAARIRVTDSEHGGQEVERL